MVWFLVIPGDCVVVVVSEVVVGVLFYVRYFGGWVLAVVLVWCMLCLYLVLVVAVLVCCGVWL